MPDTRRGHAFQGYHCESMRTVQQSAQYIGSDDTCVCRNISVLPRPDERRGHRHRTNSAVLRAHEMRKKIATSWWSYDHTRCAESLMLDCKENNTPPARVSSRPAKRTSADCLPLQHLQRCANLYSSCRCVHTHPVQGLPPPTG